MRRWETQRSETENAARLADRLVELDGLGSVIDGHPNSSDDRVATLIDDHILPARIRALDQLSEKDDRPGSGPPSTSV